MDKLPDVDIEHIAIIGMAGRFPDAKDIDQFWQNLRNGKESLVHFTEEELAAQGVTQEEYSHRDYVKVGVVLEDIDLFDAEFFGYNGKEAELMDPQQRVFLEISWEALEKAGCIPETYKGTIGVFAGCARNDYRKRIVADFNSIGSGFDAFQAMLGNDADFLSTRISYKLNLKGPSFTVQTACSTSLVAVHIACQNLLTYQCDTALAGGICIRLPQGIGYRYLEGMIASPDGHCRAFDADARGTIFGYGAGVIVLKRFSEAVEEGDNILAVIKGTAINNDGSLKVGFTAPSVEGQAESIVMAQELSGISPDEISYIEAHGTGTPLGDPVEIEALTNAFRRKTKRTNYCGIGSVKTNIGHLDAAAGIAGLIKTVLALTNKEIPPSLHYKNPNPNIDFAKSPFYVIDELQPWKDRSGPLRAGVSSFGIGGTNAHAILEEAPSISHPISSRPSQLLLLSAKSEAALTKQVANFVNFLNRNTEINLPDVAFTLQTGRKHFPHRCIAVCNDHAEAVDLLSSINTRHFAANDKHQETEIVFMFSGQGSQYIEMGEGLYRGEPVFKEAIDTCAAALQPLLNLDLRDILYPSTDSKKSASDKINQTYITQPALFVVEYALAKLLLSWGIKPRALVGHSIGEYVAACLAGVFDLPDALSLVAARGGLMQSLSPGSMLSVPLAEKNVSPILPPNLSLAVINSPNSVVISGETSGIEVFAKQLLDKDGIECRRLYTSHAFHSHMMEPIIEKFTRKVSSYRLNPPEIPFVSNVSGTWITNEEATSPDYWARHLRQTVRFFSCISTLFDEKNYNFLEVGPGQVLSSFAKQHPQSTGRIIVSTMRRSVERRDDITVLLNSIGEIWKGGLTIDWKSFSQNETRKKVPLPTYPFERKRYWLEPIPNLAIRPDSKQCSIKKRAPLNFSQEKLAEDGANSTNARKSLIQTEIKSIITDLTGIDIDAFDDSTTFTDYAIDSLISTQIIFKLKEKFGAHITFRQFTVDTPNIKLLANYIESNIDRKAIGSTSKININSADKDHNKLNNFIAIQPHGNKIPFVFVHGDGANNYLPKFLDKNQPYFGYLHQGADGEPFKYSGVKDIAKYYLEQLLENLPSGPFILGGFSFGGLVAYEMALTLLKRGEKIPLLIMVDTFHPAFLGWRNRTWTPYRILKRFFGFPYKLGKQAIRDSKVAWYLYRKIPIPSKYRTHYILSNYAKTVVEYNPQPLSCPIVLLRAADTIYNDPENGWKEWAQGGITVKMVPGDHLAMIRNPDNFKILANYMLDAINSVQG